MGTSEELMAPSSRLERSRWKQYDALMLVLAVDTSSPILSVALRLPGSKQCIIHEEHAGRGHAEKLPQVCDALLKQAGASYADIGKIVVGSGPGSFTGLRIGYAFSKGLAAALKIPLVACSSYHAFRSQSENVIAVVGDARSNLFFFSYEYEPSVLLTTQELKGILHDHSLQVLLSTDVMPEPFKALTLVSPVKIAQGLIELTEQVSERYSISQLGDLTPHYLRSAAAKTIVERSIKPC